MSMTCDIASSAPRLDSNQLPPFIDTLRKYCERANYQAAIWCWSLKSHIQIPSPAGHGWSLEEDRPVVNWMIMSGELAPVVVLELLSCRCKRRCQLPNSTCLSNGLQCTDLCTLKDSDNEHDMRTQLRLSLTQMTRTTIEHILPSKKTKPGSCSDERNDL